MMGNTRRIIFTLCWNSLMVRWEPSGCLELYGVLVLGAELPQRLAGRSTQGPGRFRPVLGILASAILTSALGYWLGPLGGLDSNDGTLVGFFVAIAVAMGRLVSEAVAGDIGPGAVGSRIRGALLDRAFPAVYAAPVFFHYLNHFA